jgi:predicted permease
MPTIIQDIRYAFRQLRKSPGFAVVAILSLALGIGANTAIFTLINSLMLKSLPVRDPQHLVSFGKAIDGGEVDGITAGPLDIFTYDFYQQLQRDHGPLQDLCAFGSFPVRVNVRDGASGGAAKQATSHLVSGNFFSVLGAEPMLGRPIVAADADAAGRDPVAVISYRYWQQELAADASVLGKSITINGTSFNVIGVMPANFYGVELNEESPDMWLPITMQQEVMLQPSLLNPHGLYWLHFMGRSKDGARLKEAQASVTGLVQQFMVAREGAGISASRRKEIQGVYVELLPGGHGLSHLRDQYSQPLFILMSVVVLVLLIACVNLANFLLSKAVSREREFSTRIALGASRTLVMRQLLIEALLLSSLGGLLGLVLAFWGTRVLIYFVVAGAKHTALDARPDMHVLLFAAGVSLLTGILFGIAPAFRVLGINIAPSLNATSRTTSGSVGHAGRLLPRILVTAQVVLSLVLLVGAGLFLRTLQNLENQDYGFNRQNVLLANFNEKFAGYKSEQLNSLHERLLNRLDSLPGVRSAALSGGAPISQGSWNSPISIQGYIPATNQDLSTLINRVSPRYFETLGIPVRQGRPISAQDTPTSTKSVVVNQALADYFFPHGDAIGHQFTIADPGVPGSWQIVGVVQETKYNSVREKPQRMIYLPLAQLSKDDAFAYWLQVRASGDPASIAGEVRSAIAEIDPNLPLLDVKTIGEQVDLFMDNERLISELSSFFSLLALALACIGLYGVMTYSVVRRTNEIGIRLALGAQSGGVLWMVLKESLWLLGIGVAVGIPVTLAVTRVIQSQLFGLSSSDPITILAAVVAIGLVTLLAAYFPARRASRVDPMVALRYE